MDIAYVDFFIQKEVDWLIDWSLFYEGHEAGDQEPPHEVLQGEQ